MADDILTWLMKQPSFKRRYSTLIKESVASQFEAVNQEKVDIDWDYLLKCASFLAHSKSAPMQDAALRISQHCLQKALEVTPEQLNSAQFILDVLSNRQAIHLAEDRGLISRKAGEWRESFIGNANWVKRQVENSVWLKSGHRIDVNSFQRSFWDALSEYPNVSISAPTSAGKSYIVKQWIIEQITSSPQSVVVYVAPTRALIAEVELDFQRELSDLIKTSKVNVTSFPFLRFSQEGKPCIYILTQERLQLLLAQEPSKIDVLVIDEAYKLADDDRGILLQHVIEKSILKYPALKVAYISPQAENPEILVEQADRKFSQRYENVTVNQNLIWATQKRGTKWKLEVCHANGNISLGEIVLPAKPVPASLKLPLMAVTLGQSGGNIIYINGAAYAENAARQLCDLLGDANQVQNERLDDLIELCKKVVHNEYRLAEALRYGVAFHYGNIPLLIKEEVEALFKEGLIKYLVCTSTLVEGVNLACKNIFIREPKRGNSNPMNAADFWNLAGRAGRWGRDFQGNIICIDPSVWDAPKEKTLMPITRATDETLLKQPDLISFIRNGTPREYAKQHKNLESMVSYLAISHIIFGSIGQIKWLQNVAPEKLKELEDVIESLVTSCTVVPREIISNHPGISPLAMKNMLDYFSSGKETPESLMVPISTDTDAVGKYVNTLKRLHGNLTNEFGDDGRYLFREALVTVHWMQGRSVNQIITERKKALPDEEIHVTIRTVLDDIERIARYKAPKFLSCYNALLKHFYLSSGREDLAEEVEDIALYLEMGVSTKTQLSLLNLGLSRASAVELKAYITADTYSEAECLSWLTNPNNNWRSLSLPQLVKREIERMLEIHTA